MERGPQARAGAEPLSARIARADGPALLALVEESAERLSERDALQCLRHPFAGEGVLSAILAQRRLVSARAVRKALALHPRTPRTEAVHCLEELTWRDLADVGRHARTPAAVRSAANRRILEKLPRLALGERIALARLADRELFPALLDTGGPEVFAALLENPRLLPEDLTAWVLVRSPDPSLLALLAEAERWVDRPGIRAALLSSSRTPRPVALALLSGASRQEWARLVETPGADPLLAACAARLLRESSPPD